MSFELRIAKFLYRKGNKEPLHKLYRKKGAKIGNNCNLCTHLPLNEIYLIEIGDNTVLSYGINFVTHDASYGAVINKKYIDLYGKIIIGKNCFVGAGSTLMYGIELGDNTIVAAGSVVTKSFKEGNIVIGGNPAKVICTTEDFLNKYKDKLIDTKCCSFEQKRDRVLASKNLINK